MCSNDNIRLSRHCEYDDEIFQVWSKILQPKCQVVLVN